MISIALKDNTLSETINENDYSFINEPVYILSNNTLIEAYKYKSMKIQQSLGSFSHIGKFEWKLNKNFFERRSDLHGITIKGITLTDSAEWMGLKPEWAKTATITNVIPNAYNVTKFTKGFYHEILQSFCKKLNCSVQVYQPKDRTWGGYDSAKKELTGLFKYLFTTDVDLIAAPLTVSLERHQVVNFLFPLATYKVGFAIRSNYLRTDTILF